MKKFSNCLAIASLIFSAFALADPVKIIYDTDMGNDVTTLLHWQCYIHCKIGQSELLAITATKDHDEVAPYLTRSIHSMEEVQFP